MSKLATSPKSPLGWLVLGEPIGPAVLLGTLVIVPAIILAVSGARRH